MTVQSTHHIRNSRHTLVCKFDDRCMQPFIVQVNFYGEEIAYQNLKLTARL